jgi:hypothetical protein
MLTGRDGWWRCCECGGTPRCGQCQGILRVREGWWRCNECDTALDDRIRLVVPDHFPPMVESTPTSRPCTPVGAPAAVPDGILSCTVSGCFHPAKNSLNPRCPTHVKSLCVHLAPGQPNSSGQPNPIACNEVRRKLGDISFLLCDKHHQSCGGDLSSFIIDTLCWHCYPRALKSPITPVLATPATTSAAGYEGKKAGFRPKLPPLLEKRRSYHHLPRPSLYLRPSRQERDAEIRSWQQGDKKVLVQDCATNCEVVGCSSPVYAHKRCHIHHHALCLHSVVHPNGVTERCNAEVRISPTSGVAARVCQKHWFQQFELLAASSPIAALTSPPSSIEAVATSVLALDHLCTAFEIQKEDEAGKDKLRAQLSLLMENLDFFWILSKL